jgi:polar amino acid transport system ATP-binding protein
MEPAIRIHGLRKSFKGVEVLRGVSLDVAPGEVVCILGPSGGGKSTMLRCINQLETFEAGFITVHDDPVGYARRTNGELVEASERHMAGQRRRIGMVFQQYNLFLHLTALQNVTEGPVKVLGQNHAAAEKRARELLASVGLTRHAHKYPSQLSGGQQQRVAIARAMAMEPDILLFDEPTSALDPEWVGEVLDAIRNLARSGMTMVIVTHELNFAREVADRIAIMADGQIIECGPAADVLDRPSSARAEAFVRRRN